MGSSAGGIVCLMLALGMGYDEMRNMLEELSKEEPDVIDISIDNLFHIDERLGMDDGEGLIRFVRRLLNSRGYEEGATFLDIAKKTGKNVVVCVSNISKKRLEYFSVDNHPDMRIDQAIRMSASVPIVFRPVEYNGDVYVDAGVYDNFPVHYFKTTKHLKDTIGVNIKTTTNDDIMNGGIYNYMLTFLHSVLDAANMYNHAVSDGDTIGSNPYPYPVCDIEMEEVSMFNMSSLELNISDDNIEGMITKGYDAMDRYCKKHVCRIK